MPNRPRKCDRCHGSGVLRNAAFSWPCDRCGGTGAVMGTSGDERIDKCTCSYCGGDGTIGRFAKQVCPRCGGCGYEDR